MSQSNDNDFVKKNILIVEDEETLRSLLVTKLRESNFVTLEAVDGVECLEKLKNETPDLILLDLIMPNRDGMDVLQKITDKNIPVVVLTNKSDFTTMHTAYNYGATKFLIKAHSSMGDIVEAINKVLNNIS